jgi:hypothetical protein
MRREEVADLMSCAKLRVSLTTFLCRVLHVSSYTRIALKAITYHLSGKPTFNRITLILTVYNFAHHSEKEG